MWWQMVCTWTAILSWTIHAAHLLNVNLHQGCLDSFVLQHPFQLEGLHEVSDKLWLHYYVFITAYLTTMVLCGNYSCHDLETALDGLLGAATHLQTHLHSTCKSSGPDWPTLSIAAWWKGIVISSNINNQTYTLRLTMTTISMEKRVLLCP